MFGYQPKFQVRCLKSGVYRVNAEQCELSKWSSCLELTTLSNGVMSGDATLFYYHYYYLLNLALFNRITMYIDFI